ncbi:uncharacterized protein LOC130382295 isoform X2 [Gadus chalcogrammus]|uniref:uncharacterized protein LOC130382295 isoform X2 n=1 Tax=Gadus chalcogrammus TaxID=1042646 RepID=UPI0024C334E9|nr:uncharacterized protein LOC130382295 isoform X2 [Gadus chalcogrammus]
MGDDNGAELRRTLVVVSSDALWSTLTSVLQDNPGGEGIGVVLSTAGPVRVCDVTVDQWSLRLLSVALGKDSSPEAIGRALDGCFRSVGPGAVVFLLLLQGGRYTEEEEALTGVLSERFGPEVFRFLLVVSLERDTVVVVDVLDDGLLELIRLCDGRFCRVTGAPATWAELAALRAAVEQTLAENGAGGYSREMLGEAGRRNTEDTAMGLLTEKLLRAEELQEAFRETVRQREEERGRELEALKRRQEEERKSEAEEHGRYQEKKKSLEEAVRSHAFMVQLEMNGAPDDETRKTSVILVGLSGSGKTSAMNLILRRADQRYSPRDPHPGPPEPRPATTRCLGKELHHRGQRFLLVDTPELLDEDGAENLEVVKDCLALALPGPHVVLLVFQTGRFTQGEAELLAQLPKTFGPQVLERGIVVFTRADGQTSRSVERYVADAPAALRETVRRCGSRYHGLNVGESRSALSFPQVKDLLAGVNRLVAAHAGEPMASRRFSTEELRKRKERRNIEDGF